MKYVFFVIILSISFFVYSEDFSTGLKAVPDKLQLSLAQAQPHGLVTRADSLPGNGRTSDRMPEQVDLSAWLPPVKSQGSIGSCSAWSTIYYGKTLQENMERDWGAENENHQFSPLYTYNQITNGANVGTAIIDHMNLVIEQGVATWSAFPYPYNLNARPDQNAENDAANYKAESARSLATYNWDTEDWEVDLNEIKTILAGGNVVIGGFDVYEDFYNYTGGIYKRPRGSLLSGHAMCIVGYDNSKSAFKIVNSWGTNWGDRGFMWMDYALAERSINWGCAVMVDQQNNNPRELNPPTGVTASQGGEKDKIILKWDTVQGADGYVIYRADNESQNLNELDRIRGNNYFDDQLPPGVTYLYTIATISNGQVSQYSELVQGWTAEESSVPGIPTEVTDYFNGKVLLLDWADLATADGYRVYRWNNSAEEFRLLGTTEDSGFVDNSISTLFGNEQGTYYLVTGVNRQGEGMACDGYRVAFISPKRVNQALERKASATARDDVMIEEQQEFQGGFNRTAFFDFEYTQAQFRAFQEAERQAFQNWKQEEENAFEAWKKNQGSWR